MPFSTSLEIYGAYCPLSQRPMMGLPTHSSQSLSMSQSGLQRAAPLGSGFLWDGYVGLCDMILLLDMFCSAHLSQIKSSLAPFSGPLLVNAILTTYHYALAEFFYRDCIRSNVFAETTSHLSVADLSFTVCNLHTAKGSLTESHMLHST